MRFKTKCSIIIFNMHKPIEMLKTPETVIVRHRKERLSKCSLRGLESREDCAFHRYPGTSLPALSGYILLALQAPPLSRADKDSGLLLLDATWRYSEQMLRDVAQERDLVWRSLPKGAQTAYPRRQSECSDPDAGLASVEALYLAYVLLGRSTDGLLDHYHWRELFLERNADYIAKHTVEWRG